MLDAGYWMQDVKYIRELSDKSLKQSRLKNSVGVE
jgi:hypothetical protein